MCETSIKMEIIQNAPQTQYCKRVFKNVKKNQTPNNACSGTNSIVKNSNIRKQVL